MKINRHGKAKILTQEEIQELFNEGFQSDRDRALFGVCLYTACRINEASTFVPSFKKESQGLKKGYSI